MPQTRFSWRNWNGILHQLNLGSNFNNGMLNFPINSMACLIRICEPYYLPRPSNTKYMSIGGAGCCVCDMLIHRPQYKKRRWFRLAGERWINKTSPLLELFSLNQPIYLIVPDVDEDCGTRQLRGNRTRSWYILCYFLVVYVFLCGDICKYIYTTQYFVLVFFHSFFSNCSDTWQWSVLNVFFLLVWRHVAACHGWRMSFISMAIRYGEFS